MSLTRRQILAKRAYEGRRNMTIYEKKLWYEFLVSYEVPFCAQKVVDGYILDFYSRRVHLGIEVDGGHHYEKVQKEYDQVRTTYLEMMGIDIIRFSNAEIWEEFDGVCEVIDREVKRRRPDIVRLPLDEVRLKR